MRALIFYVVAVTMLTGCRSARHTVEDTQQVVERQCVETRIVNAIDSINHQSVVRIDSVEIVVMRSDSTQIVVRAHGLRRHDQTVVNHEVADSFTCSDSIKAEVSTHVQKAVEPERPDRLVTATLILIFLIILTFTICKLCKH